MTHLVGDRPKHCDGSPQMTSTAFAPISGHPPCQILYPHSQSLPLRRRPRALSKNVPTDRRHPLAARALVLRAQGALRRPQGRRARHVAESLRAEFEVLKTEVVTEPQPETVEIFDPFLGETYLKTKPAPVTHLDSLPPMRMAHEPELTHDLFDPFF